MKRRAFALVLVMLIAMTVCAIMEPVRAENPISNWTKSVFLILCDGHGWGSGFAIDKRHIVTNYHVVAEDKNAVYVFFSRTKYTKVKIVATEEFPKDYAVLEVPQDLDCTPFKVMLSKNVKQGDKVYALGFPAIADETYLRGERSGYPEDVTITSGVVGRNVNIGGINYYQMDVPINRGNSGGPLVTEQGAVIGINTLGANFTTDTEGRVDGVAQGINAALQIDTVIPRLRNLGVDLQIVNPGLPWIYWVIGGALLIIIILLVIIALPKKTGNLAVDLSMGSNNAINHEPISVGRTASRPSGKTQLVGLSGYFSSGSIAMNPDEWIIIGRDPRSCHMVYPDKTNDISRRHCKIKYDPIAQSFVLVDLFSSNGTFLASGERLDPNTPRTLRPGEQFYLSNRGNKFEVRN